MLNYGMGQDEILKHFDTFSLSTLPHSIIISGDEGSGKHSLSEYIANKFNLTIDDISKKISLDYIQEIYTRPDFYLYVIDANELTDRSQNALLKLIEEPVNTAYLIILTTRKDSLLPTILNRCVLFYLNPYNEEYLKGLCEDPLILQLAHTPGEIFYIQNHKELISKTEDLCYKIFNKIQMASFANTLSILNKIDFSNSDKSNNIPVKLFNLILVKNIKNVYFNDSSPLHLKYFKYTAEYIYKSTFPNYNKENLCQNYLINLWKSAHEWG